MSTQVPLFPELETDEVMICRPFITLRNGKVLWAWQVGKKAFCLRSKKEISSKLN